MWTCFKPWRRKFGAATLLMACAIAGGWLRSFSTGDKLVLDYDWSYLNVQSSSGGLNWYLSSHQLDMEGWSSWPLNPIGADDPLAAYTNPGFQNEIKWRSQWNGFDFGEMKFGEAVVKWYRTPYWSVVILLTALSAWLLLSKRRQPTKPEPSQETAA